MPQEFEHISDEKLELYSLGTLPEPELAEVEEHLLICQPCQDRLCETDQYIQAMQDAAADYRRRNPRKAQGQARISFDPWVHLRLKPALLAAAACLFLILVWRIQVHQPGPRPDSAPVAIVLHALRNVEPAVAPAGAPLRLIADLEGLPSLPLGQIHVVGADGRPVGGSYEGRVRNGRVEFSLPQGLAPGQYWVRIYASGSPSQLLREYELRVRPPEGR